MNVNENECVIFIFMKLGYDDNYVNGLKDGYQIPHYET